MMAALTAEQRKVIGEYVRVVGDALGLRDWTFKVDHDEPENAHGGPDTMATSEKWYGRRVGQLAFRGRLADEDPEVVRHAVVHELIHLPFEPQLQLLDKALADALGYQAFNAFSEAHRLLHEEAIDHLAEVLAPHMPEFPGWPEAEP